MFYMVRALQTQNLYLLNYIFFINWCVFKISVVSLFFCTDAGDIWDSNVNLA